MEKITKYFDRESGTWKEKRINDSTGINTHTNTTDVKTYKPTLDSIRQMLATGTTKIVGHYDYDKDGNRNENGDRIYDSWQNVDITDVDKSIKKAKSRIDRKVNIYKAKMLNKKYEELDKLEEKKAKDELKEIIKSAVKD